MERIFAVILAAGKGTRMKSGLHKVLHPIGGMAMIDHILGTLQQLGVEKTVMVVGHDAEQVKGHVGDRVEYCLQEPQLGTGHAVMQAESILAGLDGITLVINGDTPLVTPATIQQMIDSHRQNHSAATLLTTILSNPRGYGRIIRGNDQSVLRIVEEKDANAAEKQIREVNVGFYCFDNRKLFSGLKRITNRNAQGEYYLTDIFDILRQDGERIDAHLTEDWEETVSINDRIALAEAEKIFRKRILLQHMKNGVTIQDPDHTYIDAGVVIGKDTVILAGCHIKGKTVIGEGCVIGPNADITNSRIHDYVQVQHSVIIDSIIDERSNIGPFAYLRPNSRIGKSVRIGDFVEIKNSTIGDYS